MFAPITKPQQSTNTITRITLHPRLVLDAGLDVIIMGGKKKALLQTSLLVAIKYLENGILHHKCPRPFTMIPYLNNSLDEFNILAEVLLPYSIPIFIFSNEIATSIQRI
jgi:hypothetical protein